MRLAINRTERMYLAFADVGGTVAQVYAVRFGSPIDAADAKRALREVVRAHPRLRAIVEPVGLGYGLRVRDDEATVDYLFESSFRVETEGSTDDEALGAAVTDFMKESFVVSRDLPVKARFVPHPERPAMLLSVHHLAGDGRSMFRWIRALVRALDGRALDPESPTSPGFLEAITPRSIDQVGRSLRGSVKAFTRPGRRSGAAIGFRERPLNCFPSSVAASHRVTPSLSEVVAAARRKGTTVGSATLAAACVALRAVRPDASDALVRARIAHDVRHYFPADRRPKDGNYVLTFTVDVAADGSFDAVLRSADAGIRQGTDRFRERSLLFESAAKELASRAGRRVLGRIMLDMKRRGRMMNESFVFSNVGRLDGVGSGGVVVDDVLPSVVSHDPLIAVSSVGESLRLTAIVPRSEVDPDTTQTFLRAADDALVRFVAGA